MRRRSHEHGRAAPASRPAASGSRCNADAAEGHISKERAAHPPPPLPHLGDDLCGAGHAAAGQRPDALVERDVHRVEQRRRSRRAPPVARAGLPQPRAVEVGDRPAFARPAPAAPTRSSHPGNGPPMSRCGSSSSSAPTGSATASRSAERQQAMLFADACGRSSRAAVNTRRSRAGRDGRSGATPPCAGRSVGVHPQRGRLRHGSAGQEHRRRLAEQLGHVPARAR